MDFLRLKLGLVHLVEKVVEHEEGVVARINIADHEGRQLILRPRRAAVEEHEAAGLQEPEEFLQHL